jgi:hypothetical protein
MVRSSNAISRESCPWPGRWSLVNRPDFGLLANETRAPEIASASGERTD